MNIFGIGLPEMAVILVLALLVFGPKKLPEIGSSLGKAIRGFQDATKDFEKELEREVKKLDSANEAQVSSNNSSESSDNSTEKAATAVPEENSRSSEG
ncbi:MAG: TatA/E family twin arginine-targeting protein translocase [Cyanobacteriota bacterium]|nr:TatA/E family twin arginine-targeting protein translocase [Cyanobacteriota bacterium]